MNKELAGELLQVKKSAYNDDGKTFLYRNGIKAEKPFLY